MPNLSIDIELIEAVNEKPRIFKRLISFEADSKKNDSILTNNDKNKQYISNLPNKKRIRTNSI